MFDPFLVRLADHGPVMCIRVRRDADAQALDGGDELFAQAIRRFVADRHNHRQRHAPLAGRAERRAGKVVDDLVEVGVGHHDPMVLGAAERLDALAVRRPARVNVLRDVG